jgi:hypothetical protein
MNATSQQKVIAAGFTIIRADDYPNIRIKHKKQGSHQDWVTLEKFETKAARDRRMAELLQSPMVIED